jgi:hypothetical protein
MSEQLITRQDWARYALVAVLSACGGMMTAQSQHGARLTVVEMRLHGLDDTLQSIKRQLDRIEDRRHEPPAK